MLEKIKDILYDVSDIVLSLIIVALIFFVVSWKISDSLAFDITIPEKKDIAQGSNEDPNIIDIEEANDDDAVITEETGSDLGQTDGTDTSSNSDAGSGNTTSSDAKPGGTQVNLVGQEKTIVIESGSSGYSIGTLLEEEGLVPDTQTFIKRVEELGLGAKLRSGTFDLSTDMSLDEVIYKISGQ